MQTGSWLVIDARAPELRSENETSFGSLSVSILLSSTQEKTPYKQYYFYNTFTLQTKRIWPHCPAHHACQDQDTGPECFPVTRKAFPKATTGRFRMHGAFT